MELLFKYPPPADLIGVSGTSQEMMRLSRRLEAHRVFILPGDRRVYPFVLCAAGFQLASDFSTRREMDQSDVAEMMEALRDTRSGIILISVSCAPRIERWVLHDETLIMVFLNDKRKDLLTLLATLMWADREKELFFRDYYSLDNQVGDLIKSIDELRHHALLKQ